MSLERTSPVVRIDPRHPDLAVIERALEVLAEGGAIVAPTETRYGLLARADRFEAVERVYALKDRDRTKALAMFVGHSGFIKHYADAGPLAQRLAEMYLPGPLTLVLKVAGFTPLPLERDGRIGIRISSSPVIAALIERTSYPLTATSANVSGEPEPVTVDDARRGFGDGVAMYLDAGPLDGVSSTVVDCCDGCRVLREGAIPRAQIEAIAREEVR